MDENKLYQALVRELVELPPVLGSDGFVRLKGDPKKHKFQSDDVRGMASSTRARLQTHLKRAGVLADKRPTREEPNWSWWIRLPSEAASPPEQQLSLTPEAEKIGLGDFVRRLNRCLAAADARIAELEADKASLLEELEELRGVKIPERIAKLVEGD